MLICLPGHSAETPLADIVAHLTAKCDDVRVDVIANN